jgi:hypothetical protein
MHHLNDKRDGSKDSLYKESEQEVDQFPEYHTKILLGDFNAKLGREDMFKLTTRRVHMKIVMTMVSQ